jgi:sugar/nucleoside kinase (ribokinase family)
MTQQFTLAGVGEAVLAVNADRTTITGVAVDAALMAIQQGHRGVVVSRVGQDEAGDDLLRRCQHAGLEVGHLQTDPDLATGRRVTRRFGAQERHSIDDWAAYDNLQWDFDLEDLTQRIDAVVCGGHALRGGQTRSTIERFLDSCSGAARFLVLADADDPKDHRGDLLHVLGLVDGVCLDRNTLAVLWPSYRPDDALSDVLPGVARTLNLDFVLLLDEHELSVCADEQVVTASRDEASSNAVSMTAIFALSLLGGATIAECANAGARAHLHDPAEPNDQAPDSSTS